MSPFDQLVESVIHNPAILREACRRDPGCVARALAPDIFAGVRSKVEDSFKTPRGPGQPRRPADLEEIVRLLYRHHREVVDDKTAKQLIIATMREGFRHQVTEDAIRNILYPRKSEKSE